MRVQPELPKLPASTDLSSKTAIVTGGNRGMGFDAALQLLQHGLSTLILAVRSPDKGEIAKNLLLNDGTVHSKNAEAQVFVWELDLLSQNSVVAFANRAKKELKQLDILILNAGIVSLNWEVSPGGNEKTFQIKYISNAVLSALLLPLLQSTSHISPSHITFAGSSAQQFHYFASADIPEDTSIFDHINGHHYFTLKQYHHSKMLLSMWTRALAVRLDPARVIMNIACPGLVNTNVEGGLPLWWRAMMTFLRALFARTAEEGARALTYGAVVAGKESHGNFIANNQVKIDPFLLTEKGGHMQEKLYRETWALIDNLSPGARDQVDWCE